MSASLASFFPRTPRQSSSSSTRPHADAPSQQLDAFGLQDFVERSSPSSAGHRPWSWLDFVVWSHAEEHDDDALLSESDTDDDEAEADDRRRGWGASSPTSLRPIPPRSLFLDFPPSIKKDNFQEGSPIIETSFGVSDGWGLTDEDVHKELVGTPANAGGSPGSVGLAKVWSYFSLPELNSPPLQEMLHPSPSTFTPSLPTELPDQPLTYDPTCIARSLPVYSGPPSIGSSESEGGGHDGMDEESGGGSEEGDDESSVVGSRGGGEKKGVRVTFK